MGSIKFRKSAIEKAVSPEKYNELIRLVTPRDWLILIALGIILFAALIWGFFGSIATRVQGQGILLAENGGIYDAVSPLGNVRIVSINVKPGDYVKKGDIVAYLSSADLANQVIIQKNYLDSLNIKYKNLSESAKQEIQVRESEAQTTDQQLTKNLQGEQEHLAHMQDLLNRKKLMLDKGIIALQDYDQTLSEVYSVKQHIGELNNQLIQDTETLNNFKQDWSQKLRELDLKIVDEQREYSKLNEQLNLEKTVRSPIAGIVTSIHNTLGDKVAEGKPIVSIADIGTGLDAIIFIPAQEGQRVKVDKEALISPDTIEKEEFGSLVAKVVAVAFFPSSSDTMMAALHNEDLVKKYAKSGPAVAVRVRILKDPKTFSGYQWTSQTGPEKHVVPGMLVGAEITVREQAPISLIIPTLRRWLQD